MRLARKTRFREIDLTEVLNTAGAICANVAEDTGRVLVDHVDVAKRFKVHGDRELLTQMFVNLVENAIRHCPRVTEIALLISAASGHVRAVVSDSGPGIPEDECDKVFRRLYRLDKSRTTAGSGLGLSLVRAIADLHGGEVELMDNRPGLKAEVVLPSN